MKLTMLTRLLLVATKTLPKWCVFCIVFSVADNQANNSGAVTGGIFSVASGMLFSSGGRRSA
jgi:hypothetical protein